MPFPTALLFFSLLANAATTRCRNLDAVDEQDFPARLELQLKERELVVKVKEKGSDNAAVAGEGHLYSALRVGKVEEAKHNVPTYYVNDNPDGDRFARDDRDTIPYLFLEPAVLQGQAGKLKLWLRYRGEYYAGVSQDLYKCGEKP